MMDPSESLLLLLELLQDGVSARKHTYGAYHLTQTWTVCLNQSQTWTCCIFEPPMAFVQLVYYFDAWLAVSCQETQKLQP